MHSLAKVADGAQGPLQGVEVVHLLQADDVGLVSDQLLQYPPPPHSPAQSLSRALHKLVTLICGFLKNDNFWMMFLHLGAQGL